MTDAFVIETRGRTAGIAVQDGKSFRFYASDNLFWNLENREFRNLRDVHARVDELIEARAPRRDEGETRNTLLRRQQNASGEV